MSTPLNVKDDEGTPPRIVPWVNVHREYAEKMLLETLERIRSGETRSVIIIEDHGDSTGIGSSGCPDIYEMAGKLEAAKLRVLRVVRD